LARLDPSGSPRLLGQESAHTARLMVYLLLAIALMAMDQRGQYIDRLRGQALVVAEPVFYLVGWPSRAIASARKWVRSFDDLAEENETLSRELLRQAGAMQRTESLDEQNRRLLALLGATTGQSFDYRFAEMLQVDLDPFSHRVIIDRGSQSGVFVGQAVIDGSGVMGQVESVQLHMSAVRLISDPDHALPVQSTRTGLRTVAFGTGTTDALLMPNIPLQADVRAGDLFVTSGLGERFPPGFPVATVDEVERTEGETFSRVRARPLAALDRGREVLLVLPATEPLPPAVEAAPETPAEATDEGTAPAQEGAS
jgi:rod shape-determining protein MreC